MKAASVIIFLIQCARVIPEPFAWWLGRMGGSTFAMCGGRDPRRALANLRRAFPQKSDYELRQIQRRNFGHVGSMALWTLRSMGREPRSLCRGMPVDGADNLREALRASRRGEGTVAFTGHFGNWELLGRTMGCINPATVVGKRMRNPLVDEVVKWIRTSTGCQQVDQQEGLRPVLRALRKGHLIGCLADQDVPALAGAFVPWFGEQAYTPTGPALLAAMDRQACMQVFLVLRKGKRWCMHVGPRWQVPAGDRTGAAHELTAQASAYFQTMVERYPEQWVWWHMRWRTRPEARPQAAIWQAD